jgi:hypothetical protein
MLVHAAAGNMFIPTIAMILKVMEQSIPGALYLRNAMAHEAQSHDADTLRAEPCPGIAHAPRGTAEKERAAADSHGRRPADAGE